MDLLLALDLNISTFHIPVRPDERVVDSRRPERGRGSHRDRIGFYRKVRNPKAAYRFGARGCIPRAK